MQAITTFVKYPNDYLLMVKEDRDGKSLKAVRIGLNVWFEACVFRHKSYQLQTIIDYLSQPNLFKPSFEINHFYRIMQGKIRSHNAKSSKKISESLPKELTDLYGQFNRLPKEVWGEIIALLGDTRLTTICQEASLGCYLHIFQVFKQEKNRLLLNLIKEKSEGIIENEPNCKAILQEVGLELHQLAKPLIIPHKKKTFNSLSIYQNYRELANWVEDRRLEEFFEACVKQLQIQNFSSSIKKLDLKIKVFHIRHFFSTYLPVKSKKILVLKNKHLTAIPSEFKYFTQLKIGNLSYNRLIEIQNVDKLIYLTSLNLNHNQLKVFPRKIENLKKLQWLFLSDNQLKEIPSTIGRMSSLRILKLAYNQLTALPKEMGQLTQLEWLFLNNNQLKEIPESIGLLKSIEILNFSHNQIHAIAPIGDLIHLKWLELHHNQLKEAPLFIRHLQQLEFLNLNSNPLKEIPKEIKKIKNLKWLYFNNTKSISPPLVVIKRLIEN